MDEHPNAKILRGLYERMKDGDFQAGFDILADEVESYEIGRDEPTRGKEALGRRYQESMGDFDIETDMHDVLANDEHAIQLIIRPHHIYVRGRPPAPGIDDGHLASAGVTSVPLQANEYAQAQQRARPRPRHDGEVVGDVWVWRANATRSEIHHAVHSTKSTPSRTSRTKFSPATLAAAPTAAAAASTSDRRDRPDMILAEEPPDS